MKNIYAAIITGAALSIFLEFFIGFTSAIAIPKFIFETMGVEMGLFLVNIFLVTIPYFLTSFLVIPFLAHFAKSKTLRYSIVTIVTIVGIIAWKSNWSAALYSHYWSSIPLVLGLLSIALAAWLVTKYATDV